MSHLSDEGGALLCGEYVVDDDRLVPLTLVAHHTRFDDESR